MGLAALLIWEQGALKDGYNTDAEQRVQRLSTERPPWAQSGHGFVRFGVCAVICLAFGRLYSARIILVLFRRLRPPALAAAERERRHWRSA